MDIKKMFEAHKLLAEFRYDVTPLEKGYTDKVLYINLSNNSFYLKLLFILTRDIISSFK